MTGDIENVLLLHLHIFGFCEWKAQCIPITSSSVIEFIWFAGSNPARVDGFFQNVKILSMTSFGREVKMWMPCRRFRHVEEPPAKIRASKQNVSDFSRSL